DTTLRLTAVTLHCRFFPTKTQINKALEQFFQRMRKKYKTLGYLRFPHATDTELHFHFLLFTHRKVKAKDVRQIWKTIMPTYLGIDYRKRDTYTRSVEHRYGYLKYCLGIHPDYPNQKPV